MYKILVVEDNKVLNRYITEMTDWHSMGMEIIGNAFNGEQGLHMALENEPDLVIADVDMPKLDGLMMCTRIKENLPDVRFIFISSFDSFQYVKDALNIGAYKYLLKPVMPDDLITAVHELFEMKNERLLTEQVIETLHKVINSAYEIQDKGDESDRNDKIVSEIKSKIETDYANLYGPADVINDLQISASHANFIFKSRTGMTVFDYLVRTKINAAMGLLKDPFIRVYEVANKVGYENTSHFISVFKAHTGMTPKQFTNKK